MRCIQQTRSYLELTLVRLKLSSNLLVPNAFSYQLLVSVLSRRVILGSGERAKGWSTNYHKIIRKTAVMELFLVKL